MKRRPLAALLTFWPACACAAALVLFAAALLFARAESAAAHLDNQLTVDALTVLRRIAPALGGPSVADSLAARADLASLPFILRDDDDVVFRSPAFPRLDGVRLNAAAPNLSSELSFATVVNRSGQRYRVVSQQVRASGGATYALQVAVATSPATRAVEELAIVLLLGIPLVLAPAHRHIRALARRALRSIGRSDQSSDLARGHDPAGGGAERLVITLNGMLATLEQPAHMAHRFAASVSHELQTPLAAMRCGLEAWMREDRSPEQCRDIAVDLLSELDRLSSTIRDLRLLAVAGSGHLVRQAERMDVGELVGECCEIARVVAQEKQIRIDARIEPRLAVIGSAVHLRSAILNLTQNAIRYSRDRSVVRVTAALDGDAVQIEVSDTGCGIPASDLPRIFEPFFRGDSATPYAGGTGLGLAIAGEVVRAHGGRIAVTSLVGAGSTFIIHLPATAHRDEPARSHADERPFASAPFNRHPAAV